MCRLSWNLEASTSWNPQGLSRPVMGLIYLYIYIYHHLPPTCFGVCYTILRQIIALLAQNSYAFCSVAIKYLLTYLLHPSWEANRFSASQEIPSILRNPKVHYGIHKCPPPVLIISQLDPAHIPHPTSCRSTLILSSYLRLGLPSGLFPTGFPIKTLYAPHPSPIRAKCQA